MGKHAAPRNAATPTGPALRSAQPPRALVHTVMFGVLAVFVAVVASTWAGTGPGRALAVGAGLVVVGGISYLVVRRTGLLDAQDVTGAQAASRREP